MISSSTSTLERAISSTSTLEHSRGITPEMIATVYRKAAERLDRLGWIQGQGKTVHGECTLQAICTVANEMSAKLELPSVGSLHACKCPDCMSPALAHCAQQRLMGFVGAAVPTWNDHLGRTYAEVRAALIQLAELVECAAAEQPQPTVERVGYRRRPGQPDPYRPVNPANNPASPATWGFTVDDLDNAVPAWQMLAEIGTAMAILEYDNNGAVLPAPPTLELVAA